MRGCHVQLEECYDWCAGCRLSCWRPFYLPCVSTLPNQSSSSLTFCQGNKLETEKYKVKLHHHSPRGNTMSTIWLLHGRSSINMSWTCYSQRVKNILNNILRHVLNIILNNILLYRESGYWRLLVMGSFKMWGLAWRKVLILTTQTRYDHNPDC